MQEKIREMFRGEEFVKLGNGGFVEVNTLAILFEDAENIDYESFLALDAERNYGYAGQLKIWKEQGLIE